LERSPQQIDGAAGGVEARARRSEGRRDTRMTSSILCSAADSWRLGALRLDNYSLVLFGDGRKAAARTSAPTNGFTALWQLEKLKVNAGFDSSSMKYTRPFRN